MLKFGIEPQQTNNKEYSVFPYRCVSSIQIMNEIRWSLREMDLGPDSRNRTYLPKGACGIPPTVPLIASSPTCMMYSPCFNLHVMLFNIVLLEYRVWYFLMKTFWLIYSFVQITNGCKHHAPLWSRRKVIRHKRTDSLLQWNSPGIRLL